MTQVALANNTSDFSDSLDNTVYAVEIPDEETTLFLPAYAVLVIKSVDSLSLKDGTCSIKATFVLRVMLEGLQEYAFVKEHLEESVSFRLNERPFSMKSDDENVDFRVIKTPCLHLMWTSRMEFPLSFIAKLRNSPFDTLRIPIKLELTSQTAKNWNNKKEKKSQPKKEEKKIQVRYRFNFHKYTKAAFEENKMQNLKFKETDDDDQIVKISDFNLLYSEMGVDIKIEEKKYSFKNKDGIIILSPVIIFNLGFYRKPFSSLFNCLGPIVAMMFVPLAIYFQPKDLATKMSSLITLLLAIFAYFPTLRSGLPSMPYLTITDMTACLCLVQVFIGGIEALCLANLDAHVFSRVCLAFLLLIPIATITFLGWNVVIYYYKKKKYDVKPDNETKSSSRLDPLEWEGWRPNSQGKDHKENKVNERKFAHIIYEHPKPPKSPAKTPQSPNHSNLPMGGQETKRLQSEPEK